MSAGDELSGYTGRGVGISAGGEDVNGEGGVEGNGVEGNGVESMESMGSVIEGVCMECYNPHGRHTLAFCKLPHFKETILQSFQCDRCGFRNSETTTAAPLKAKGRKLHLTLHRPLDLNRQVVKSEYASFHVPKLEFEIPPNTQKGVVSTVEGLLRQAVISLEANQCQRRLIDEVTADKIQTVIDQLNIMASGEAFPFEVMLDDASGNSYIEAVGTEVTQIEDLVIDSHIKVEMYERTQAQLHEMGHFELPNGKQLPHTPHTPQQVACPLGADLPGELRPAVGNTTTSQLESLLEPEKVSNTESYDKESAMTFETPCGHCRHIGATHMCEIDIPGFRNCIIMSFVCESCGAKSSEVKPSGPYGKQGRRWTLRVEDSADLNRDVLKSDAAGIEIPDIELVATAGTQGGTFTTVEGLLLACAENLEDKNAFVTGDSSEDGQLKVKLGQLVQKLKMYASGADPYLPFTLIIDDMADHSYIGSRYPTFRINSSMIAAKTKINCLSGSTEEDKQLTQLLYDRTTEQNDFLGISDMKTEDY